jgi:predicted ATPase/DNA-binding CsgD family transcriptional regulator/Flp pilus assembly protein TadD
MNESLTEREREILRLIADGRSNDDIARALTLTVGTVKWYNTQIFGKLGVRSRTEAVAQAQRWGIDGKGTEAAREDIAHAFDLPAQPVPFTGRARELAELEVLCHDGRHRMVTLVGPGGIGKTRLALALAERRASRFPDGVTFVPLAPLRAGDSIAPAIAAALNLRITEGSSPAQQIITHLRGRHMLLLLDNFDLVLSEADFAAELLRAAPGVRIVVTSRERLNILEETVYRVDGMTPPSVDTETLADNESVRLFLHQATRVRPDFAADEETLRHIAEICRLVEGMPLALILAAAWVEMLTPGEIAHEIRRGVDFLATELRDIPERHRSLRAIWTSTWAQMSESELKAFARITVFRGGFTREAAEAVTGTNLRTLMSLVHKSLVRRDDDGRFSLHELLRQYAEAEHQRMQDATNTYRTHSQHYLDRVKGADGSAVDALEADFENIRAAWGWAIANGEWELAAESLTGFQDFCSRIGRFLELRALYDVALQREAEIPRSLCQHICGCRGAAHFAVGAFEQAIDDWLCVYEEAKRCGDEALQRLMLVRLGKVYRRAERHIDAKHVLTAAIAAARAADDLPLAADALHHLGTVYWSEGENQAALANHREARQIAQRLGLSDVTAIHSLHGLGEALHHAGEPQQARESFEAAYALALRITHNDQIAENLEMIGWSLLGMMGLGDNRLAQDYFIRALALSERAHMSWHSACTLHGLATAQGALGAYESAIVSAQRGIQLSEEVGVSRFVAMGLETLGTIYQDIGRYAEAEAMHHRAIQLMMRQEWAFWQPRFLANLAIDRMRAGDLNVGSMLREALELGVSSGQIAHAARALEALAEFYILRREPEVALAYAAQLLQIAELGAMRQMQGSAQYWRGEALLMLGMRDEATSALATARSHIDAAGHHLLLRMIQAAQGRL